MSNFKRDLYKIEDTEMLRLIDEYGTYWYPIQNFFNKILLRRCNITQLRNSEVYRKYMEVFEFVPLNITNNKTFRTWCMNAEGMHMLLKNTYIKPDSPKKMQVRERRLAAARIFFNVKIKESDKFLTYRPIIDNYDTWSILCIKSDISLCNDDIWKRCESCNYYYPCTPKYFIEYKNSAYSDDCLQCRGYDFKCDNKIIQWFYNHDGLNLLYYILKKDKEKVYEELLKIIEKGGLL